MKKYLPSAGFTLIEMIGTMAIIAILAGIIAPSVIHSLNVSASEGEVKSLQGIKNAIEVDASSSFTIPGPSNWTTIVAQVIGSSSANVLKNNRGFVRGYYVSPSSNPSLAATGFDQAASPQTTVPTSVRIMIASDLTGNAPASPSTQAAFDAIWDQTAGNGFLEDTTNGAKKRVLQRIDMQQRFHRMVLISNSVGSSPYYQIESAPVTALTTSPYTFYLLEGTKVSLYPTTSTTTPIYTSVIYGPTAYMYDDIQNLWIRP